MVSLARPTKRELYPCKEVGRRVEAPTNQGNWASRSKLAWWTLSKGGVGNEATGGTGVWDLRRRWLRAKVRPPRAPNWRHCSRVLLKRICMLEKFLCLVGMTIH